MLMRANDAIPSPHVEEVSHVAAAGIGRGVIVYEAKERELLTAVWGCWPRSERRAGECCERYRTCGASKGWSAPAVNQNLFRVAWPLYKAPFSPSRIAPQVTV
jgi:hypothetical protein